MAIWSAMAAPHPRPLSRKARGVVCRDSPRLPGEGSGVRGCHRTPNGLLLRTEDSPEYAY